MKNKILSVAAIAVLTLSVSGCSSKQEIVKVEDKSICPVLNIENTTQEQFDMAKGIKEGLQFTDSTLSTIYMDTLKQYNKTDNVEKYISKDSLKQFSVTLIWGTLVGLKYSSGELADKVYDEVLNTIDANNPNWCEPESYKHITDKYTKLSEELKRTTK
ncbi:hypothetical protein ACNSOL_11840 (plasmid) [Aliarcobacter lanthieri]|uniref:hypothetical protein n=1 Tax=Aliarcobacter lanthieri TaxID=1355374 RepID=UPI003AAA541D